MGILKRIRPAYALVALFSIMLILGLLWGGFGKVFLNGAIICLDCIGII